MTTTVKAKVGKEYVEKLITKSYQGTEDKDTSKAEALQLEDKYTQN